MHDKYSKIDVVQWIKMSESGYDFSYDNCPTSATHFKT